MLAGDYRPLVSEHRPIKTMVSADQILEIAGATAPLSQGRTANSLFASRGADSRARTNRYRVARWRVRQLPTSVTPLAKAFVDVLGKTNLRHSSNSRRGQAAHRRVRRRNSVAHGSLSVALSEQTAFSIHQIELCTVDQTPYWVDLQITPMGDGLLWRLQPSRVACSASIPRRSSRVTPATDHQRSSPEALAHEDEEPAWAASAVPHSSSSQRIG